jgi:quercetin dioxygenase-like cupin family protein
MLPRMKTLVAGAASDGRSCVLSEHSLDDVPVPGRLNVFSTTEAPPPPRPPGHGLDVDLRVAPGLTRWGVIRWPAGHEAPMHHTDTIDYDTVLAGSLDLILDDGVHHLLPGDCVVVDGVDHAWKAGPEGCTFSVLLLGMTPSGPG